MDTSTTAPTDKTNRQRLQRPREGRVLGGVAAGISQHTGASIAAIRLGFLVAALFGGFGILLYAAAWALLPDAEAATTPAEQWLANLTTPGKRIGAFLIGLAALIVLAGAAPLSILGAVVLLAAAALLANGKENPAGEAQTPAAAAGQTDETEMQ
jgi:phage shock protein PspC (stress-responsive transcriptional regulator)